MKDGCAMLRLLYVDDDADLRDLAQFALDIDPDVQVATAASGADAISACDAMVPDAILLDVMMPGMDGPQVLAALRRRHETADVPVIFVTARVLPDEQRRLVGLGAVGVITKPFDPMTLAADVRKALTQHG